MARIYILALLLAALMSLAAASSAPTFCKCTCFKNSTIIPLGPEHQSKRSLPFFDTIDTSSSEAPAVAPRSASTSCSECTKAFCLQQARQ
ncbi:hypothetical protein LMH87_011128 [Akanthomyces muscarius]|uniref:Secreted protein n=1 Tax=Akanthomyces muscarius TaxID=2231603 RepID=A0A9W8QA14_AKAMU|nr:hypothetical protein LMH87_011128 [Akanthomyces muscarius]KAJ4150376.1 hypothetical protein LMH87_011128 [Akanthomyces muscarius]